MLRALRVVLSLALLIPPYPVHRAFGQEPDSNPPASSAGAPGSGGPDDGAAAGPENGPAQPPHNKEAKIQQLADLLKSFSDNDYQSALQQSGVDASGQPSLASRSAALKTAYTTLAAMEYHAATKEAPGGGAKYADAYKRVVERDAASVAVNPETMQETGRFMDILKIAAKAALKYGITAAIMAAGSEIKSPEEARRDGAIGKYESELASADLAPDQKAEAHYQLGSTYEQAAAEIQLEGSSAEAVPDQADGSQPPDTLGAKQQRLATIANFLQAISDRDYKGAIGQALSLVPIKGQRPPLMVSRGAALQATYNAMAALQYQQADQQAPSEKYSQAYARAASGDAAAASVDGQNVVETGWVTDVFKFLANAAINYETKGGEEYVGRQVRSPEERELDKRIESAQSRLAAADLSPEEEAKTRYALGAAYEERAKAAAAPEDKAARVVKKEARIKQLTGLLTSVSDEEYRKAVQQAGVGASARGGLASRTSALRSAYTTLAGLEYHQASSQAPDKSDFSGDYKRVAGEDAKNLAVDPDTLQETGWFTDLLGLASLGGIGYLVYTKTQKKHSSPQAPAAPPVACPPGTALTNGRCQPPLSCPDGTKPTGDGGCMATTFDCPQNTTRVGNSCVAACPEGTNEQPDGTCRLKMTCPAGSTLAGSQCVGDPTCPAGAKLVGGECVISDVDCPAGSSKAAGGGCVANFSCPPGTGLVGDDCVAACPTGTTRLADGSCRIETSCPQGTTVSGNACVGAPVCPFGSQWNGSACMGSPVCPSGSKLDSDGDCMIVSVECPSGTALAGGRCVAPCPAGSTKNPDGTCKGITECPSRFSLVGDQCLGQPVCPPNSQFSAGRCVASQVSCPPGSHLQAGTFSPCFPCDPLPGHLCPRTACAPPKPSVCVADGWNCPAGTSKSGGACIAACPSGTSRLADGGCQPTWACPPGTTLQLLPRPLGMTCVAGRPCPPPPVSARCMGAPTCPPGSRLAAGRCLFTNVECPPGSKPDSDGDCVIAEVECPGGTRRVASACVAPCPPGTTTLSNGSCRLATVCAAGSALINGRCIGDPVCAAPAALTGGRCLLPPTCPPETAMVDNRCRPECPAGETLVDDRCRGGGHGEGAGFAPSVVVSPGEATSTSASGRAAMARDSKGNLYIAYTKEYKGRRRVFVARSGNGGTTWQDTTTRPVETTGDEAPGLDQGPASLAIDSHDVLHLAWSGWNRRIDTVGDIETKIAYAESPAPGAAWTAAEKIPGARYEGWEGPAQLLVDSKDGLHLVWQGQDGWSAAEERVRYAYRAPGSKAWTHYIDINGSEGAKLWNPSAALDGGDVLHVVAMRQAGAAPAVAYASRSPGGAWTAWKDVSAEVAVNSPATAVDARNNLHVAWISLGQHVSYARRSAAGAWSVTENLQPAVGSGVDVPALAADAAGNVYLAWASWAGSPGQPSSIRIMRFNGNSWTAWRQVAPGAATQHYPSLRWAERDDNGGDLAAAWTEDDGKGNITVRYAQDPSAAMPGAARRPGPILRPAEAPAVATGRNVGASGSLESLEEGLASDDLTPEKASEIHHELGAAYEKLAMALPAASAAGEPSAAPPPARAPAAAYKPQPKPRPKPRVKPAAPPPPAEEAQEPQRHVPSAAEGRDAEMKKMEGMEQSMEQEVEKRRDELDKLRQQQQQQQP